MFSAHLQEAAPVDGSEKYLSFYARLICTAAKVDDPRIEEAFRSVKREPFAGPGPWSMGFGGHPYVQTPDDDPAFLYQNLLVALDRARGINIGMPSFHALWLGSCNIKPGETVLQIGAGSGYYGDPRASGRPPRPSVCLRSRRNTGCESPREPAQTASGRGAHAIGRRP
jgi:hypothetical protein